MPIVNPYLHKAERSIDDNLYVDLSSGHTAADFVNKGWSEQQKAEIDNRPAASTVISDTDIKLSDEDDAYLASLLRNDR